MSHTLRSIRFYVNDRKDRAAAVRDMLAPVAAACGLDVVTGDGRADAVLALGGDGTMLRAVHEFPGVPLLGLNLGGLGYLASVGEEDFSRAVEMLARGRFKVAERSMLSVRKRGAGGGDEEFRTVALNDVVIMREMSGHAAILDLSVDEKRSTRYLADGIIVATPTGSTAYSLSAGGPVLMPDSESFVITPMNPHALGVRPLVVGDCANLAVSSHSRSGGDVCKIGVYADGENVFMLEEGETLEIVKAPRGAAMVELEGYDPCEVLARKLGWSGSCVAG
jgi:NAD+ kinase